MNLFCDFLLWLEWSVLVYVFFLKEIILFINYIFLNYEDFIYVDEKVKLFWFVVIYFMIN